MIVALSKTLAALAPRARPSEPKDLVPESSMYRWFVARRVDAPPEVIKDMADALRSSGLLPDRVSAQPGSSGSIDFSSFAEWMLAQAQRRAPEDVVKTLVDMVSRNSVEGTEILTLWGIHPVKPITFPGGVALVPIADIPDSDFRDAALGANPYRYPLVNRPNTIAVRPTAALTRRFTHIPFPTDLEAAWDASRTIDGVQYPKPQYFLQGIANALVLVDNSSVCRLNFLQCLDDDVPVIGGGSGGGGFVIEHRFVQRIPPKDYEPDGVRAVVARYRGLTADVRQRLDVPLTWLNRALRSAEAVDQALELGIALDSLLTGRSERSSTYMIKVRGTHLRGGTSRTRHLTFRQLGTLYGLRSDAAHEGKVPDRVDWPIAAGKTEMWTSEALREGMQLGCELVRCILSAGHFPQWDKLVIGAV